MWKIDKAGAVVFVCILALGGLFLLVGCESSDRAATERAIAEAETIRARSEASAQAAQDERDASRLAHQQFLETLPVILSISGMIIIVGLVGLFVFWDLRRRAVVALNTPETRQIAPHIYVMNILPSDTTASHREHWRQIEKAAHHDW